MALYRVKQFYWGVTAKINEKDKEFLNKYLSKRELHLFNQLNEYEKKHCVNTAMDVEAFCLKKNIKGKMLVKAAILHDIGKITNKINLVEKSFMVVLDKVSKEKIKKYCNRNRIINCYYNHGDNGYKILKDYGYDEEFLYLIKNHHNNYIIGDKKLDIIRKFDNMN